MTLRGNMTSSKFSRQKRLLSVAMLLLLAATSGELKLHAQAQPETEKTIRVRLSWGHGVADLKPYHLRLETAYGFRLESQSPVGFEAGDSAAKELWNGSAGGGDTDALDLVLRYRHHRKKRIENLHIIWADTISEADSDSISRWAKDANFYPEAPKLTVLLNEAGDLGFSLNLEQLLSQDAFFIPSLGFYVTVGDSPKSFAAHMAELKPWAGKRVLDRVQREPDATLDYFKSQWEDMGDPHFAYPEQRGPGHIVCLAWDSSIAKFGIDRGAGVWNDYGNPDKFQFWFDFGDLQHGAANFWKEQRLQDGLPIITTVFERDGVRYQVEQFAFPLDGVPDTRRGDMPMVLLQKITLRNLEASPKSVPVTLRHRRRLPAYSHVAYETVEQGSQTFIREVANGKIVYSVDGPSLNLLSGVEDYQSDLKRIDAWAVVDLPAGGERSFVVKLPSAIVGTAKVDTLASLNYETSKAETVQFWNNWLSRGAQFEVPEKEVNDLFRASLWHALRLPRRHGGEEPGTKIDLPYSNFAYSQTGTPWPVNQAVYVDYGIYSLRGYHDVAAEEVAAQNKGNQELDGHITGYANWVVYTPGQIYSASQGYLLSQDSTYFEKELPATLRAADWTMAQSASSDTSPEWTAGLVEGPLNDLTGNGYWGFNQAYKYAALHELAVALKRYGHPRAAEFEKEAKATQQAILHAFGYASARSPIVELRDHTWVPFVPTEATVFRRRLDLWYPTDVDTGPLHMVRLGAIPANHPLAGYLLNDHEDNLYFRGLGIANEPVYNQQSTAYLLRDEVKPVIRGFYSYMASAFSHTVYEPVEHRYTHGQYFGPPSTDGAWFELYRNMLLRETQNDGLFLAQATPREWLAPGKSIVVRDAPSRFGKVSFRIDSKSASRIDVEVSLEGKRQPNEILLRLRQSENRQISGVKVNGVTWTDFDNSKEWIRIPDPKDKRYVLQVDY